MRVSKLLILFAAVSMATGCEWLRKMNLERDNGTQIQTGPVQAVSTGDLVGYLNRQSSYLHGVRYQDVYIDVYAGKEHYTLGDSTLVCTQPRNFRLVGGKRVLGDVVDLGSNDREFWMYSRFPEQTYVFCSHVDFQGGRGHLPFPFDPDWALQAIGMATFDPNLPYKVDTDQRLGTYTLTVDTTTPHGMAVKRSIIFDPRASGTKSHVRQHLILDSNGKLIASADIKESVTIPVGTDPQSGKTQYAQVPTRVTLDWPQQQFKMDMKLRTPKVNERLDGPEAAKLFRKPAIDGVNPINLAEARFAPSGARAQR